MVDRGALRYRIEVRDGFSASLRQFRDGLRQSRQEFERLRSATRDNNLRAFGNITRAQRSLTRSIATNNELLVRQLRLWRNIREEVGAIGTAGIGALARDLRAANRRLSRTDAQMNRVARSTRRINKESRGLIGVFGRLAQFTLAFQAFAEIQQGISSLVSTGVRVNASFESAEAAVAGLALATSDVVDSTGRAVEAAEGYPIVFAEAREQVNRLRQDALRTTATFEELLFAFQTAVAPGRAAGLDLDEIRQLTVTISQAATQFGLAQNQLAEELRSLFAGTINPRNTRLATGLGITNEDIRLARQQGELFEFLSERFDAFGVTIDQSFNNLNNVLARTRGVIQEILAQGFTPLTNQIRTSLLQVEQNLRDPDSGELNTDVIGRVEGIAEALAGGIRLAEEFVNSFSTEELNQALQNTAQLLQGLFNVVLGLSEGVTAAFEILATILRNVIGFFDSLGVSAEDLAVALAAYIGFVGVFRSLADAARLLLSVLVRLRRPLAIILPAVRALVVGLTRLAFSNPITAGIVAIGLVVADLAGVFDSAAQRVEGFQERLENLAKSSERFAVARRIGEIDQELERFERIRSAPQLNAPGRGQIQPGGQQGTDPITRTDREAELLLERAILIRLAGENAKEASPEVARLFTFLQSAGRAVTDRSTPAIRDFIATLQELRLQAGALDEVTGEAFNNSVGSGGSQALQRARRASLQASNLARRDLQQLTLQAQSARRTALDARRRLIEGIPTATEGAIDTLLDRFGKLRETAEKILEIDKQRRQVQKELAELLRLADTDPRRGGTDALEDQLAELNKARQELAADQTALLDSAENSFGVGVDNKLVQQFLDAEGAAAGYQRQIGELRDQIREFDRLQQSAAIASLADRTVSRNISTRETLANQRLAADANQRILAAEQQRNFRLVENLDLELQINEAKLLGSQQVADLERDRIGAVAELAAAERNLQRVRQTLADQDGLSPEQIDDRDTRLAGALGLVSTFRERLDLLDQEKASVRELAALEVARLQEQQRLLLLRNGADGRGGRLDDGLEQGAINFIDQFQNTFEIGERIAGQFFSGVSQLGGQLITESIRGALTDGFTGDEALQIIGQFAITLGQAILEQVLAAGIAQLLISAGVTAGTAGASTTVSGTSQFPIFTTTAATGGFVQGFAQGGPVFPRPNGIDRRDTIPAWLRAGEYVLRPEAVAFLGRPFLDFANQAGQLGSRLKSQTTKKVGFADGGFVSARNTPDPVSSQGPGNVRIIQTKNAQEMDRLLSSRGREELYDFLGANKSRVRTALGI